MKVSLIYHIPQALELLLFTKGTRLSMNPMGLFEVASWSDEKKQEELNYMLNTIRSSWEMVDYIFSIEDVSRAFTHQLVRHRVGTSFAQQSQRTVDMSNFRYVTTDAIQKEETLKDIYDYHMRGIQSGYADMISSGAMPEDARGLLPTNICTNIIFKANLRTLSQMCGERLCVKAQGEFQQVMKAIRESVIAVHPWAEPMLRVHCAQTGVCCFPSVNNCKIKDSTFDPSTGKRYDGCEGLLPATKEHIQSMWTELGGELKKPNKSKPKIFCFINSSNGHDWHNSVALSEDGHFLAGHTSSSVAWAKHDMGFGSDWQHDLYAAHYPDGYELVWVDNPETHEELRAAYQKHIILDNSEEKE